MIRLMVLTSMLAVGTRPWARKPQPNHPIRRTSRRQGAEPVWRPRTPRCDPLILITTLRGPAGHPQT